jgi:probable phosphoglycerate mutase
MASEQHLADDSSLSTNPVTAGKLYRQIRYSSPAGATEIVLVRHGESEPADPDRPFPLLGGRGDPALSPLGREQAALVADRLAATRVDAIYVTSLRRTAETAAPLGERLGLVPRVEPDLAEVLLGEWEGGTYRQRIAEGDPLAVQIFKKERWDVIPGAESNEAIADRVGSAISRIAEAHGGARVVCVAHGGTIGAALAIATGSRPFAFIGSDNAAISTIVVAGSRWLLRGYNDRSHLDQLPLSRE